MADIDDLLERAWRAYADDDAGRGTRLAEQATRLNPDDGPAWYCLACCRERLGQEGRARAAFRRAASAAIDPQAEPCRIDPDAFHALAERVLAELPVGLQPAVQSIDLVVMDHCPPGLLPDRESIEILGLCDGLQHSDLLVEWGEPVISPRLYLFRRTHEHACADRDELAREMRITAVHELGHHLGFDEDDLEAMGLG